METSAIKLATIQGKFISGHYNGTSAATITVADVNDETIHYKCNINKQRTPELYETLKDVHTGTLLTMNGAKVKNQATGEWQYIIR